MDMLKIGEDGFIGVEPKKKALDSKVEESLKVLTGKEENESPEDRYLQGLKAVDLDLEGARAIQEALFVRGYYEEEVFLGIGRRFSTVLRTRQYRDTVRANRRLEADQLTFVSSIHDTLNQYNTAASLIQYGDKAFDVPAPAQVGDAEKEEASFRERLEFIQHLPGPVCLRLMQAVFDFDRKVGAVFADGAPLDF